MSVQRMSVCRAFIGGALSLASTSRAQYACRLLLLASRADHTKGTLSNRFFHSFSLMNVTAIEKRPITLVTHERNVLQRDKAQIRRRWLRLLLRATRLLATFGPMLMIYPLMRLTTRTNDLWWTVMMKLSKCDDICRLVIVLLTVEHSGPTLIKLAQWAATRRDLFSAEFCNRLLRLQRRTAARSFAEAERVLRATYGEEWPLLFRHFERESVGSGAIAQASFVICVFLMPSLLRRYSRRRLRRCNSSDTRACNCRSAFTISRMCVWL